MGGEKRNCVIGSKSAPEPDTCCHVFATTDCITGEKPATVNLILQPHLNGRWRLKTVYSESVPEGSFHQPVINVHSLWVKDGLLTYDHFLFFFPA